MADRSKQSSTQSTTMETKSQSYYTKTQSTKDQDKPGASTQVPS